MSKKQDNSITIREYVTFNFTYYDSVQRVAMALIQSGYYANITTNEYGGFKLNIYTDRGEL